MIEDDIISYFTYFIESFESFVTSSDPNSWWVQKAKSAIDSDSSKDLMLALIHPVFFKHPKIPDICFVNDEQKKQLAIGTPMPRTGIAKGDDCFWVRISGETCALNSSKFKNQLLCDRGSGKPQADHVWPQSLGGPSVIENRMLLCATHNRMKGNSANPDLITKNTWLVKLLEDLVKARE